MTKGKVYNNRLKYGLILWVKDYSVFLFFSDKSPGPLHSLSDSSGPVEFKDQTSPQEET